MRYIKGAIMLVIILAMLPFALFQRWLVS